MKALNHLNPLMKKTGKKFPLSEPKMALFQLVQNGPKLMYQLTDNMVGDLRIWYKFQQTLNLEIISFLSDGMFKGPHKFGTLAQTLFWSTQNSVSTMSVKLLCKTF